MVPGSPTTTVRRNGRSSFWAACFQACPPMPVSSVIFLAGDVEGRDAVPSGPTSQACGSLAPGRVVACR